MDGLDIAAIIMLFFIGLIFIAVVYFLASWPGRIAVERNHPCAAAIQIGGWATLLFGGIFWPLVLMWAYVPGERAQALHSPRHDPSEALSSASKAAKE